MASEMIPIHYSGFWDFPMVFITLLDDKLYLFDRGGFDEELDDYLPTYKVYRVENIPFEEAFEPHEDVRTRSVNISERILYGENEFIGEVQVKDIRFDETHRHFFDASILRNLMRHGLIDY